LGTGDDGLGRQRARHQRQRLHQGLQKYQNYPNGLTANTNGVFEYLGVHLTAMNESMLQSYNDRIAVFPAAPADSTFTGKFTLLAKDGFLVSSEREAGDTKYIGIKSLYGKQATVVNPWSGQQIRVRRPSDNAILATTNAATTSFATAANTAYVIERVAKPFTWYASTRLTGSANQGPKSLSNTASTLGMAAGSSTAGTYNDSAATYDANWYLTTNRGHGDYNDDTHHTTTTGAAAQFAFTGTGIQLLSERNGDM
jgi:hypothetical protein